MIVQFRTIITAASLGILSIIQAVDAAQPQWQAAPVKIFTSAGVKVTELRNPFLWASQPQIRWFDDNVVLFNGVDLEKLAALRAKLRRRLNQNSRFKRLPRISGSDYKEIFGLDLSKRKYVQISDHDTFCFNYISKRFFLSTGMDRNFKIVKSIEEIIDPIGYSKWPNVSNNIEFNGEEYIWRPYQCFVLPKNKYKLYRPPFHYDILPLGDGYIYFNNVFPSSKHSPSILNLDGALLHTLPIQESHIVGNGVRYANWRQAYYASDRRNRGRILSLDEKSRKDTRFQKIWRKSNCLRLWWFSINGLFEEECIPFVQDGVHVYPLRGGNLILARDSRRLDNLKGSGAYWAPKGAAKATRIFTALIVQQLYRGDISPDGCRAAIPAMRPDGEARRPQVMRLMIIDVC